MNYNSGVLDAISPVRARELDQLKSVAVFIALTALGAKVYIPHEPVPFTLQTLFVVLAGAFLGWRAGTLSMITYLLIGAAGVPVFAGAEAGPSVLLGPTAGYLFGFVTAACFVGATIRLSPSFVWTILSMFIGFLMIFICGTLYLNLVFLHNWRLSITQGFLIFSYWDLVKLGAAVAIYRAWPARISSINN